MASLHVLLTAKHFTRATLLFHLPPGAFVNAPSVRNSSKGSPGQSQGRPRKGQHLVLKVNPGTEVVERQVVLTQRGLRYHPGLNAALHPRDNAIYAVCDGKVIITTEKISPDLSHEVADKYYASLKGPMFKRFVNIIPKKEPVKFRLVDLV